MTTVRMLINPSDADIGNLQAVSGAPAGLADTLRERETVDVPEWLAQALIERDGGPLAVAVE